MSKKTLKVNPVRNSGGELDPNADSARKSYFSNRAGQQGIISNGVKKFKWPFQKWQDCAWRRIACGKDSCPICGRIKKDRQKHIDRGEDPDSIKSVMEDVGGSLREALTAIKADAKAKGFDITNIDDIKEPPEPELFPLYLEINLWRESIYKLAEDSDLTNSAWLYNEAGEDLLWYANTLAAKTYRQLCNRWHLDNGDDYGDYDYAYTDYAIKECLKILNQALSELGKMETEFKNKFKLAQLHLNILAEKIKMI